LGDKYDKSKVLAATFFVQSGLFWIVGYTGAWADTKVENGAPSSEAYGKILWLFIF
jgi:hypothetical protein